MVPDPSMVERQREGLVGFLKKLLSDLEAGRAVHAALDLQAFIDELEGQGEHENLMESDGPAEAPGPSSPSPRTWSGMVAESIWT